MKRYIDDFVEDLNYRKVILYIGNVDSDSLRSKMKSDNMGHTNRFAAVMANHLMYSRTIFQLRKIPNMYMVYPLKTNFRLIKYDISILTEHI